jgi:hypothetical protein
MRRVYLDRTTVQLQVAPILTSRPIPECLPVEMSAERLSQAWSGCFTSSALRLPFTALATCDPVRSCR